MDGSPTPTGPTSTTLQSGRARARPASSSRSSLVATTAPVNTIRGPGSGRDARVDRAGFERGGEQRGVGDVRGVQQGPRRRAQPLGQRGRRGDDEVGARDEPRLRRPERGGVDALLLRDVVDAVVDHGLGPQRVHELLGLRDVGPEQRARRAPRRPAHLRAQQEPVERAHGGVAVQRQDQRRQDAQAVTATGAAQPADQAPRQTAQVAPGDLRAAQAERLDEEHVVVAGEPAHQVLLVGPELGVPLGEADADDGASREGHVEPWSSGRYGPSGSRRGRSRSNSSIACS